MPDTALPTAPADWPPLVRAALDAWRDGNALTLAASPLAHSTLAEDCFLSGEARTPDARARTVQAVLHWGIERLRPDGSPSWTAKPWRVYNLLYHFYAEGQRMLDLAEKMSLTEPRLYEISTTTAVTALATTLHTEWQTPQDAAGRRQTYLASRYASRSDDEQRILRATALFRRPVPPAHPELLAALLVALRTRPDWARFVSQHWIVSDPEYASVLVHPEARPYILAQLSAAERTAWNRAAGDYYLSQHDYLEAAEHLRAAHASDAAAEMLIAHYDDLLNAFQTAGLQASLARFHAAEVTALNWSRLHLLKGKLAEALKDLPTAIAEYGHAMSAPDVLIKAEACYRRARVLRAQDIQQALTHYQRAIALLDALQPRPALWTRAWIDIAWFYLEDRPDFAQARHALEQVEAQGPLSDFTLQALLHNAWGEWSYRTKDIPASIEHHHRAWLAALETRDINQQMHSAYNLGTIYAEYGQPQQGFSYLQQSLELAVKLHDRRIEALCHNGLGEYYYWLQDYREAVNHYESARAILSEIGHTNWLATIYYNLTEALCQLGEFDTARPHFEAGLQHATTLDLPHVRDALLALAQTYPDLLAPPPPPLTPYQVQILTYMRDHEKITSAECADLIGRSKETAIRELNKLVNLKRLVRLKGGSGTYYVLP